MVIVKVHPNLSIAIPPANDVIIYIMDMKGDKMADVLSS